MYAKMLVSHAASFVISGILDYFCQTSFQQKCSSCYSEYSLHGFKKDNQSSLCQKHNYGDTPCLANYCTHTRSNGSAYKYIILVQNLIPFYTCLRLSSTCNLADAYSASLSAKLLCPVSTEVAPADDPSASMGLFRSFTYKTMTPVGNSIYVSEQSKIT